jgi:DNA-binding response OmpR family regulator
MHWPQLPLLMVPRRVSALELEGMRVPAEASDLSSRRRLLLVHDGPGAGYPLSGPLTALGWEVDCAQERAEAEALLLHRPYDAVIIDLRAPPLGPADSLALLQFMRSERPQARAVVLLDGDSSEVEGEIWRLGAAALLQRPQPLSDLHRLLRDLLAPAP